jgi:hypothetical protein
MPQITLTGARFHGFKFTTGPKRGDGAPMVIAEFSASWTEKNRKAGDWKEVPDTVGGQVKLIPSELACTTLQFKPGGGLEAHAFSIDVSEATDFKCFVPTKEGDERELRFHVKSASIKAGKQLDAYGRTAGNAKGTLKLTLDGDTQERLISEDQAQDTLKDD